MLCIVKSMSLKANPNEITSLVVKYLRCVSIVELLLSFSYSNTRI